MITSSTPDYLYPQQSVTAGSSSIYTNGFIPERYNSTSTPIISIPKNDGMNSSTKITFSASGKSKDTTRKSKDKEENLPSQSTL